jgi:hypothetical protein
MADGLPERATAVLGRELATRLALAKFLLPNTDPIRRLLQRFDGAGMNDLRAGRQSFETFDIGVQILRKAKIPAALQKEIRRVRELRSQAATPSAVAEPPSTAAEVED